MYQGPAHFSSHLTSAMFSADNYRLLGSCRNSRDHDRSGLPWKAFGRYDYYYVLQARKSQEKKEGTC